MGDALPAISGKDLIKLLKKDGWIEGRQNSHIVTLRKTFPNGKTRITVIQPISASLKPGTLSAILGDKQTGIGRDGLRELIKKYGL